MSTEDQLATQLHEVIAQSLQASAANPNNAAAANQNIAETTLRDEEDFYKKELHRQHIADRQSARGQREKYALRVFVLVAVWISALLLILIVQGADTRWRPFSDKVLIALISSMSVNLIGTLVIVLKYIFKSDLSH